MNIAVTGVSGLLASNLVRELVVNQYQVLGLTTNPQLSACEQISLSCVDYFDRDAVVKLLKTKRINILVHCAALTSLQLCESDPAKAKKINIDLTEVLNSFCDELGIQFIYISTDSVYQESEIPVSEDDKTLPLNEYAASKLEAETKVSNEGLILRANFFGRGIEPGNTLADWVIRSLSSGQSIIGFDDVYFSPLYVRTFSDIIIKAFENKLSGVFNVGAGDALNKYQFCEMICAYYGYDSGLINHGSVDEFKSNVKRPKNVILNSNKISKELGIQLPTVSMEIEKMYRDEVTTDKFKLRDIFSIIETGALNGI